MIKRVIILVAVLGLLTGAFVLTSLPVQADTQTWTTAGTYSWTCPANVANIKVQMIGGGGSSAPQCGDSGGGGGGGAYAELDNYSVTPGNSYTVVVGLGGLGGNQYCGSGHDGGDTYFVSTGVGLAKGGHRGTSNTGGQGGQSSACVGDVTYSGGNGVYVSYSNGGGASGWQSGNGNNGSGSSGGSAQGIGGAGGNQGSPGGSPGGGAGNNGGSNQFLAGADGEVIITYTAVPTCSLSYSAGSHGSLLGNTSQTVACNGTGNGTAVTANPDSCYHFTQWSDSSTQNPRQDDNVSGNISVTASFALTSYSLAYSAGSHGSLTGNTSQVVSCGGNGAAVTVVPSSCYHFASWSDSSTANPRTDLNVAGNISVTASFVLNQYSLLYYAGSGGSLSGNTSQTVSCNGNGTAVTAVADPCWWFSNWSDSSTANPRTDLNVGDNISVTALFGTNYYRVDYAPGAHGTLTGNGTQYIACGGNTSAVTAVPDWQYLFAHWSDSVLANPRSDSNVTAPFSVQAVFQGLNETLSISVIGNGTTSPAPGVYVAPYGYVVDLSAIADLGYQFDAWSGPVNNSFSANTYVLISGNDSVTATFSPIPPIGRSDIWGWLLLPLSLGLTIISIRAGAWFWLLTAFAWFALAVQTEPYGWWAAISGAMALFSMAMLAVSGVKQYRGRRR